MNFHKNLIIKAAPDTESPERFAKLAQINIRVIRNKLVVRLKFTNKHLKMHSSQRRGSRNVPPQWQPVVLIRFSGGNKLFGFYSHLVVP